MKQNNLATRLRNIKLVIFDVDGVLTDGKINLLPDGREMKSFNVLDGTGIKYLQRVGIEVALLTGRSSDATKHRAKELGIKYVVQGSKMKAEELQSILKKAKCAADAACFVGDDLPDVPCMRVVGLAVSVADARPEVKRCAHWITRAGGGHGVAREVAERILKAQGKWKTILARYFPDADEAVP